MTSPRQGYDVVIVGGGAAGTAAAIAAARNGLSSLVVEAGDRPRPSPCAGWLGPAAVGLCRQCGADLAAAGGKFAGLRLHPWEFKTSVEVEDPDLVGWVVDPTALSGALLDAARAAGADVMESTCVTQLELGEEHARVQLSTDETAAGKILVVAGGVAAVEAGLVRPSVPLQTGPTGACVHAELDTPDAGRGLDVVIGGGRALRVAAIVRGGDRTRVSLLTRDRETPPIAQFDALLAGARAAGLLPQSADATPTEVPALAGAALEIEAHTGKRCLIVGDAGGFVTAFSNEGLYPALRSGWLAAETARRALSAPVPQDELATFSTVWRAELADYLRMPNTDLGLLMPMVFNNAEMSRRVGRAFLLGEGF